MALLALVAVGAAVQAQQPVLTRAVVRSISVKDGKTYVYLKIMPRSKLPFTTQTLLVQDQSLVAGLAVGDEVGFAAEHREGENTLVAIHKVPACKKFQPCPLPE